MQNEKQGLFGYITLFVILVSILLISAFVTHPSVAATKTVCPIQPQTGRIIVMFKGHMLANQTAKEATLGPFAAPIPTGYYKVTLSSFDHHTTKKPAVQLQEQWYLTLLNAKGKVTTTTPAIGDLAEDKDTLTQVVHQGLQLKEDVAKIVVHHSAYPSSKSAQSIYPVCAAFDPVKAPSLSVSSATPTPTPTLSPTPKITPSPRPTVKGVVNRVVPTPTASVNPTPTSTITTVPSPTPASGILSYNPVPPSTTSKPLSQSGRTLPLLVMLGAIGSMVVTVWRFWRQAPTP